MGRPTSTSVLWFLLVSLSPSGVWAQTTSETTSDPAALAKLHLGALALLPRISLTNVGVDTNVFNESAHPQRDFNLTLVPRVDSWLRLGRTQLSGKTSVELVYFRKSATQRSANFGQEGQLDVMLVNATPYVAGGYLTSSQRPNAELDARVQRTTKKASIGSQLQLGAKTTAKVEAGWSHLALDGVEFDGINLAEQLDREVDVVAATLNVALTPLTSFVVRNELQHDRFDFEQGRNTNSLRVVPGLEFKPMALVSGRAFVGYRRFSPKSATVPGFVGVVSTVDLTYVARDATRLVAKFDRDVDYSFELEEPYFVTTGGSLTVTQVLFGSWDSVFRVGRQRLDYQHLRALATTEPRAPRRDSVGVYGVGVGYRLAVDARVGFDVDYAKRRSLAAKREYQGFRFGGSFTYGF